MYGLFEKIKIKMGWTFGVIESADICHTPLVTDPLLAIDTPGNARRIFFCAFYSFSAYLPFLWKCAFPAFFAQFPDFLHIWSFIRPQG
jgi:hypothetical protein